MPDRFSTLASSTWFTQHSPSSSSSARWHTQLLSSALDHTLDRVNVLGDEHTGHTGCVNALSWAKDGVLLLSGGDDTTVRLWRMNSQDTTTDYPFVCDAVIHTGHRSNIFNAQLLPHSSRIATVARDREVRISDIKEGLNAPANGSETLYTARQSNIRTLKCHTKAVKRIVTEDSPDLFLTVSEDGTVRQHDLRTHHECKRGSCPAPLVRLGFDLSTIALSPLTPYQFVVAGESPYGYLFDRRQSGRHLLEEWGVPPDRGDVTTCVRRFGRSAHRADERTGFEHITGARMATTNGHELLLSYSSDAVYLYSTKDEPLEVPSRANSSVLKHNKRPRAASSSSAMDSNSISRIGGSSTPDALMEEDISRFLRELDEGSDEEDDEDEDEQGDDGDDDSNEWKYFPQIPTVMPRTRFAGACNIETVKDVSFLGPQNEFVASGSDDGHLFVWKKSTGKLHDILEGDGNVVNVIEGHPHLPLVAVSGIDFTVKLFAPSRGTSVFSRIRNANAIMRRNSEASSTRMDLTSLVVYTQVARRLGFDGDQCTQQ